MTYSDQSAAPRGPMPRAKAPPPLFERPGGVLALVVGSAVVASLSSFVVLGSAIAAREGQDQARLEATARPAPSAIAPDFLPQTGGFDAALPARLTPGPDVAPMPRLAMPDLANPQLLDSATAVRVIAGPPPVLPQPRPVAEATLVSLARGLSEAEALTFSVPAPRPEGLTTTNARLVASASLRPALRPDDLDVSVATRSPDLAALEEDGAGGTALTLASLGEIPRSGGLFGTGNDSCNSRLTREMPRRPGAAAAGSTVMAALGEGSGSGRDARLVQEALAGNMPDYMRALHPVQFTGTVGGRSVEVVICVTPDYLAIGSNSDHVRVPLGLPGALQVAEAFDMMLPTTTMVDAIYAQADIRVAPSPMTPGAAMSSTSYFVRHDRTVDGQFTNAGARQGMLVAGHKKDLVIANRLSRNPGRVAIYGWHRTNGRAIQPLSTVHGAYYADYSHGIRLVSRTAYVNGRAVDLRDLLTDSQFAGFLNSDGALTGATVRLASL